MDKKEDFRSEFREKTLEELTKIGKDFSYRNIAKVF